MVPQARVGFAGVAALAAIAALTVVLHSPPGGVSLGQTYTYTAAVPAGPSPDQVFTYATSTPGDNTYTYKTSVLGECPAVRTRPIPVPVVLGARDVTVPRRPGCAPSHVALAAFPFCGGRELR
jgi:hypothetical protein